jgi:CheY-like chemotaxis protein
VLRAGPLPDVILLDLMMPVMNGWQFREEQKKDPRLAAIPVVVLSADSSLRDKAGLFGGKYLSKPVNIESLLGMIVASTS